MTSALPFFVFCRTSFEDLCTLVALKLNPLPFIERAFSAGRFFFVSVHTWYKPMHSEYKQQTLSPMFFNNTGIVLGCVGDRRHFILLLTGVAQVWDAQRYPLIIPAESQKATKKPPSDTINHCVGVQALQYIKPEKCGV